MASQKRKGRATQKYGYKCKQGQAKHDEEYTINKDMSVDSKTTVEARDYGQKARFLSNLECRKPIDTPRNLDWFRDLREAILKFAIFNNGILLTELLELLLPLHLNLERGFAARDWNTIKIQNGYLFWFPTTTPSGLT
jgi:hypothetical protein